MQEKNDTSNNLQNNVKPAPGDSPLSGSKRELTDEEIHITASEEDDEEYAADSGGKSARRNLVTGIPESEFEVEGRGSGSKKKSPVALIAVCASLVIVIMAIAVFFILRGKTETAAANVKDNSPKFGVNAGGDSQVPDYQRDYANRYVNAPPGADGITNGNTNGNSSGMMQTGTNGYGTVGGNITAPPLPPAGTNPAGGIYQPGSVPPPPAGGNSGNSGSGSGTGFTGGSNGGNSGGTNNQNKSPVRVTTGTTGTTSGKETEIVELPDNQLRPGSNGNSGGGGRNDQVSLYFYDRADSGSASGSRSSKVELERGGGVPRPNFGTVLPVKMLGRLHTLGTNGLARMELTRSVEGSWGTLPRGTMFIGRVAGGEADRLFVSLLGYIEPRSNRLVTLGGDLQGKDGALGIEGDIKRVSSQWKKIFSGLLTTAKEIGTAYLVGRGGGGSVINTGHLAQAPNALTDPDAAKFVLVAAGSTGYIVINDLPPAIEADDRFAANRQVSDEDILKMIQTQSPADIQRIIPQLSPTAQGIARGVLDK